MAVCTWLITLPVFVTIPSSRLFTIEFCVRFAEPTYMVVPSTMIALAWMYGVDVDTSETPLA